MLRIFGRIKQSEDSEKTILHGRFEGKAIGWRPKWVDRLTNLCPKKVEHTIDEYFVI